MSRPAARAVALAPSGSISQVSSSYDPIAYALRNCGRFSPQFRLYAVDNDVVWTGPKSDRLGGRPGARRRTDHAHERQHATRSVLRRQPGLQLARPAEGLGDSHSDARRHRRGKPTPMLFSVVDDGSEASYQEYRCI